MRRPVHVAKALMTTFVVALAVISAGCGTPSPPTAAASEGSGGKALGYSVEGASIRQAGVPYTPYGITIFGLARPNWASNVASDLAQIGAVASFWRGNVVRIQVAPPIFLANSSGYVSALRREVGAALALRLNVIVSAQYQSVGGLPGPDTGTVAFWRSVAGMYRGSQEVWFDLLNEPEQPNWNVRKHGGDGFVGMQTLVDTIRGVAPHNLIIAEGLRQAETLLGVQGDLLHGSGIVYSVHPYLSPGWNTPNSWDANWGDLSSRIPVLVGKWGEYDERKPECNVGTRTLVPQFLDYLRRHRIGLIAWALVPGVLIREGNLTEPTAFDPGVAYTCTGGLDIGPNAQRVGRDVLGLFTGSTSAM